MADINVFDWMELTRPNKAGLSAREKSALKTVRRRVFKIAKTSTNALVVAKSRGSIGRTLYDRVKDATADIDPEKFRITVSYDDFLEQVEKERAFEEEIKSLAKAARA